MIRRCDLVPQYELYDKEIESAIQDVLKSGRYTLGENVESFEDEFCEFMNLPKGHAAALSSGSASLYLALWSLDAKGKKIIFPSYACSALGNAVKMADGNEIIIDNKKNSINLDLEKAKDLKHDIKIIPHMFGIPNNLSEVKSGQIIEDCAQSLGAKVNDNYVGTQGTVGIFSFYVTKMMTSGGQGGMIISKNKEIIEKVKDYREFDFRSDNEKRFNFQMTEIQAAIGREQLKKLPELIEKTLLTDNDIQSIASTFNEAKGSMFLGRGFSYPIALEGALKLKELSYIHAEGYPAGEMKHGPLALIEEGLPVIVIAPKDKYFEKTLSNMQEVIARGGKIFFITDNKKDISNDNIRFGLRVPFLNNLLSPILLTVPLQLLAYHVAFLKNCDIDKPRNLAKSVTVE